MMRGTVALDRTLEPGKVLLRLLDMTLLDPCRNELHGRVETDRQKGCPE
jgi:hypothetical protein